MSIWQFKTHPWPLQGWDLRRYIHNPVLKSIFELKFWLDEQNSLETRDDDLSSSCSYGKLRSST